MPWNEIWKADMEDSGLLPFIKGREGNGVEDSQGYLLVDLDPFDSPSGNHDLNARNEVNVLTNVHIKKKKSYELIEKLFDNYVAKAKKEEVFDPQEISEIEEFLKYAINTEPMKVARNYLEGQYDIGSSDDEWIEKLFNIWFKPRKHGSTSVFEHVFLGEQSMRRRGVLDGHHFWYNYYLNDGPYDVTKHEDRIYFLKTVQVQATELSNYAEAITISYNYLLKDNDDQRGLDLHKKIGGFFVGLSAEGLLAMGTVGYFMTLPQNNDRCGEFVKDLPMTINGEKYNLKVVLQCGEGETFYRTFYPMIPR
ncbi:MULTISPECIES: hypothetical protein [Bacillus cereus group]|uniref:hypothetical protein n=1 Tax=Bacillus cereus group TaxID=86661 RepID=UPI000B44BA02|nr:MULTISPECIES: hypothetical protein [Bacillus cereus group]KAA0788714.1 hypothetical protein DN393_13915 [Bacillus sp. BPN334]OUB89757.1 hypothetical protein BK788_02720 [Bacillus thuringiensis serovar sinensis]